MYCQIRCSNSSPILELSVKFASQICHENINKPLDGTYLVDFGIDIDRVHRRRQPYENYGNENVVTRSPTIFMIPYEVGGLGSLGGRRKLINTQLS